MWQQDAVLLAEVCSHHPHLREAYLQHLIGEVDELEGGVVAVARIGRDTERTEKEFKRLCIRFSALVMSAECREVCLAVVREKAGGKFEHRMAAVLGCCDPSFAWSRLHQELLRVHTSSVAH